MMKSYRVAIHKISTYKYRLVDLNMMYGKLG